MSVERQLYGLLAEFESPEAVIVAAQAAKKAGFEKVEAYTPFPVMELPKILGYQKTRVPLIVLIGAILGGVTAFGGMYYANVWSYVLNVGGRPLNSWPAFIPITFEVAVLGAATFAFFGLFVLCKLPQPYHPLFNVERFAAASHDKFFLCIEADDSRFELSNCRSFFEGLSPLSISEVPTR